MANFDLDALMERLIEMEKESIDALVDNTPDAVKYFPYEQEAFPYWNNRITVFDRINLSQDIVIYAFDITARLVIGHLTEGYRSEIYEDAYDYIASVLDYFADRALMNSNTNDTPMEDVWCDDDEYGGLEIIDMTGPAAFANAAIDTTQVAIEFVFRLPVIDSIY